MSFQASVRQVDTVSIIDFSGRITLGDESDLLRETLNTELERGHKKLLLNLRGVTYCDSAGLGELVGCFTKVGRRGGSLKLLYVPKKIRDILQVTRLDGLFEICSDEEAAVKSFGITNPTVMSKILSHFRHT
ncbi:MAG: STAS domain-containing protein [Bryobacteraceae bacterium]